jgi:hypothetical protein
MPQLEQQSFPECGRVCRQAVAEYEAADLPLKQPNELELVINTRIAKALKRDVQTIPWVD